MTLDEIDKTIPALAYRTFAAEGKFSATSSFFSG